MSKRYEVKDDGRHIGGYLGGSHVVAWQPGSHSAALVRQLLADIAERDARIAELTASRDFAMEERDGWIVSHAQLFRKLGDLLAVIHRDGGHYESEHGTEKACADAELAVHVQRGIADGYHDALKIWRHRAEQAESRLAAIEAAPTVAWQGMDTGHFRKNKPDGALVFDWRPLIARPAKD